MTKAQIHKLCSIGVFPEMTHQRKLVETHISWVILCDRFVYKIKKPIRYSFLDFSTCELRKHFCEREMELNQRLTQNVYLEVLPIHELNGVYKVGGKEGVRVDYALKMHKLEPNKRMDILLAKNKVAPSAIKNLAKHMEDFHKNTTIIYKKNALDLRDKFNDLSFEKEFLSENLDKKSSTLIDHAIEISDTFLFANRNLLHNRLRAGFFRDCHGDLHTRNIFLLPDPQPFDCIEFNDDYRQIDVLNEIAFLCMDLDALGRQDLSELFVAQYNLLFPVMRNAKERQLFSYYKGYRANIRAKVNSLRAKSAANKANRAKALHGAQKYLSLMADYLDVLETSHKGISNT